MSDVEDEEPAIYLSPEDRQFFQKWKNAFARAALDIIVPGREAALSETARWTPEQMMALKERLDRIR